MNIESAEWKIKRQAVLIAIRHNTQTDVCGLGDKRTTEGSKTQVSDSAVTKETRAHLRTKLLEFLRKNEPSRSVTDEILERFDLGVLSSGPYSALCFDCHRPIHPGKTL